MLRGGFAHVCELVVIQGSNRQIDKVQAIFSRSVVETIQGVYLRAMGQNEITFGDGPLVGIEMHSESLTSKLVD